MKFVLTLDEEIVEPVTSESIEDTILELEEPNRPAIILEPEIPINQCNFIQAYYPTEEYDDGLGYRVELSILTEDSFVLYKYRTIDVRDVISIFINYFEAHQVPNIENWEDMMDELR